MRVSVGGAQTRTAYVEVGNQRMKLLCASLPNGIVTSFRFLLHVKYHVADILVRQHVGKNAVGRNTTIEYNVSYGEGNVREKVKDCIHL